MTDDFEPRENDHLVEPMFAGLGVRGEEAGRAGPLARWWSAVRAAWRAVWRRIFRRP